MKAKKRNSIAYKILQAMILSSEEKLGPNLEGFKKRISELGAKNGVSKKSAEELAVELTHDVASKLFRETNEKRKKKYDRIRSLSTYIKLRPGVVKLKKKLHIHFSSSIKKWKDFEKQIYDLAKRSGVAKRRAREIAEVMINDFLFSQSSRRAK